MTTNTGGPAFPSTQQYFPQDTNYEEATGMTLRDYFAAKAMQGLVANDIDCSPEQVPHIVASAYIVADAMLKARES